MIKCILHICLAFMATAVLAEETSRTAIPLPVNKKFEDTGTLTDPKLRADDGSLSRYSLKSKWIFRGPTVGDLSSPDQPNPDGTVGNNSQYLKAQLMARFRTSSTRAWSFGTGMVFNHPLQGVDRTEAKDPYGSYDIASKVGSLEMRNSPGFVYTTTPELLATGQVGALNYTNTLVKKGSGRASWGLETVGSWFSYKRGYRTGSTKKGGDGHAQEYSITLTPVLNYSITDRVIAYSNYGFAWYNSREVKNKWALYNQIAYLRVGAAYSVGRYFYVSPYLDMYPGAFSAKTTTANIQTIFSIL